MRVDGPVPGVCITVTSSAPVLGPSAPRPVAGEQAQRRRVRRRVGPFALPHPRRSARSRWTPGAIWRRSRRYTGCCDLKMRCENGAAKPPTRQGSDPSWWPGERGLVKGVWFDPYVIIDIFSRYGGGLDGPPHRKPPSWPKWTRGRRCLKRRSSRLHTTHPIRRPTLGAPSTLRARAPRPVVALRSAAGCQRAPERRHQP